MFSACLVLPASNSNCTPRFSANRRLGFAWWFHVDLPFWFHGDDSKGFSGDLMMVYSDAWNKFQKYYPKWWRKMVIYYCGIRKTSPENKQFPLFPLISQATLVLIGDEFYKIYK